VDQTLVRTHLEVLARVLVLVRRSDHAVAVDLGRQRYRARDLRPGTRHRLDYLPRRRVDDLVVICLEPDADLLSRHGGFCSFSVAIPPALRQRTDLLSTGPARAATLHGPDRSPTPAVGRVAAEGQAPPVPASRLARLWLALGRCAPAAEARRLAGCTPAGRHARRPRHPNRAVSTARNATYSVCRNQDGNVKSGSNRHRYLTILV